MRNLFFMFLAALLFGSCGINQQVKQLRALEHCKYKIASADSIYLANTDVSKMIRNGSFNLTQAPAIAIALLRQNVPLQARINLQIKNTGNATAGINKFEYRVLIKEQELTAGYVDQKITIQPGSTMLVPVKIDQNIYPLLADPGNRKAVTAFLSADSIKKTTLTLKIKPSILIGTEQVQYPGYISINKEVTNKALLSAIEKL